MTFFSSFAYVKPHWCTCRTLPPPPATPGNLIYFFRDGGGLHGLKLGQWHGPTPAPGPSARSCTKNPARKPLRSLCKFNCNSQKNVPVKGEALRGPKNKLPHEKKKDFQVGQTSSLVSRILLGFHIGKWKQKSSTSPLVSLILLGFHIGKW